MEGRICAALACLGWALMLGPGGCASPGVYVWYTALPPDDVSNDYLINAGDLLNIRVLGHDDMTTRTRVRLDGRIALPIIGEVEARGKRPNALRTEIETRLKDYLVMPSVTLNIEEAQPIGIAVLGEVTHPGVFPVDPNMRLAQVLALGGGLTEFASRSRIFVVRTQPRPMRIRFTYDAVTRDEGNAATFRLRMGDIVVVE